jgi:hypothetical protein
MKFSVLIRVSGILGDYPMDEVGYADVRRACESAGLAVYGL